MNGTELIAAERARQVSVEGWTPEHDKMHDAGELATAAVCYAEDAGVLTHIPSRWPWEAQYWKPSDDPIRNLVKAGALIAAEIDRLQGTVPAVLAPHPDTLEPRLLTDGTISYEVSEFVAGAHKSRVSAPVEAKPHPDTEWRQ